MPIVKVKTKELKNILKTFSVFAGQSFRKNTVITMVLDPSLRMVMSSDHAHVFAVPTEVEIVSDVGDKSYSFDSSVLLDLALAGPQTQLSWEDKNSPLKVQDGKFKTELKIAVKSPAFGDIPQIIENHVEVPLGFLSSVVHLLQIPYSYFKAKKELLPIRLFERDGLLCVGADDGFSLAELSTTLVAPPKYELKIPYYILQAFFSQFAADDVETVKINSTGFNIFLTNKVMSVHTNGLNETTLDLEEILKGIQPWITSCKFDPKMLTDAIKPIMSVIPTKDTSGAIIIAAFGAGKVALSLRHPSLGNAQVDDIDGMTEVHNEKSINLVHINMHPKAFQDYTGLFSLKSGSMYANNNAVLYEGKKEIDGKQYRLRYLFPTVQM